MISSSQKRDTMKISKNADENTTHISTKDLYTNRESLENFSHSNQNNGQLLLDSTKSEIETVLSPRTDSEPSYDSVCVDNMIKHENGQIKSKDFELIAMKNNQKKKSVHKLWSKLNFWSGTPHNDKYEPSNKTATSIQPFSDKDRSSVINNNDDNYSNRSNQISSSSICITKQISSRIDENDDEFGSDGLTDKYTQPDMWVKKWEQQTTSKSKEHK